MPSSTEPVVSVKDLVVNIDNHRIIDHVSFDVPAGSTTAVIGPNGAGKSILLKTILRLIPKTSGEISIFGTPHEQYRRIASRLSYIPQSLGFDRAFPLTVSGLFSLKSPRPFGMSSSEKERMGRLLEIVGMSQFLHAPLHTLSGGQLQRVLLGYSLMDNPELLILDEPSAGIDVQGQETIYSLLQRIQKEENLTLILVSHELEIVMRYATQVLCLNKELLCAGIPREVLSNQMLEEMYGAPISHFSHSGHQHP